MQRHDQASIELWEEVRYTKPAIRARATLLLYTILASFPFIVLVAAGGFIYGLRAHELIGVGCYHAMLTSLFLFDTLRNAAHDAFAEATAQGQVTSRDGIPVVDPAFRHHRLARLAFAIGGGRQWRGER